MKAIFTKFDNKDIWKDSWVNGTVEDVKTFEFSAKLYDEASKFGIDNGRVSKFDMYNEEWKNVAHYDRGWDKKPTQKTKKYFDTAMDLLENSPKRWQEWEDLNGKIL